MKEFEIVGMKTMGNMELLQKPHARIGVYASRQLDNAGALSGNNGRYRRGGNASALPARFIPSRNAKFFITC